MKSPRPSPGGRRTGTPTEAELRAAKRTVSRAERHAVEEAERLCQDARRVLEAASIDAEHCRTEAEAVLAKARAEAERVRAEAEAVAAGARAEASSILSEASRILDEARAQAPIDPLAQTPEPDQPGGLDLPLPGLGAGPRASEVETSVVTGTGRTAAQVLRAAEDDDEAVRAAAYRRLAAAPSWVLWIALGRCSRRPELLAALEERDETAGRLAALVADRMSSPEVADRVMAVELAGTLLPRSEDLSGRGTSALLADVVLALADTEAVVRRAAAAQLGARQQAIPDLVAALRDDPDPAVRRETALALADAGDKVTVPAFVGALQDPDPQVRRIVVEALLQHPSPDLARRLTEGLATSSVHSVGEVLAGMGPVAHDALAAAVVEGPPERASAATELLKRSVTGTGLPADRISSD